MPLKRSKTPHVRHFEDVHSEYWLVGHLLRLQRMVVRFVVQAGLPFYFSSQNRLQHVPPAIGKKYVTFQWYTLEFQKNDKFFKVFTKTRHINFSACLLND